MQKSDASPSELPVIVCFGLIGFGIGWLIGLSVSPVVSIVVSSVTAAVAAIIAALIGLTARPTQTIDADKPTVTNSRWDLNPLPLALLMGGIIIGSIFGIRARNYNWMGSDLSSELAKWTDAGLNETEVARRLFEVQYPYTPYVRSKSLLHADLPAEFAAWISATNTLTNSANLPLYNEIARHLLALEYPTTTTTSGIVNPALTTNNPTRTYGSILSASAADTCDDLKLKTGPDLVDELNKTAWKDLTTLITDTEKLKEIVGEVLCATGS